MQKNVINTLAANTKNPNCRKSTLNIVDVAQSAKLLLTGGVPYVEANWAAICVKHKGMHFNAQRS